MRRIKSVSFDIDDEFESNLLNFAENKERGRFSKYIKRLIADDMSGNKRIYAYHQEGFVEDDDTSKDKLSFL